MTILVWLRHDLRLTDNPALYFASQNSQNVIPLYILDESMPWSPGRASQWWLHNSLLDLRCRCKEQGVTLLLQRGHSATLIRAALKKYGAKAIYWNHCFEPALLMRDKILKKELQAEGIEVKTYNASLLHSPHKLFNKQGSYYKVFSAFWRNCALQIPQRLIFPLAKLQQSSKVSSDHLESWNLLPNHINWAQHFHKDKQVGEAAAMRTLEKFIENSLINYANERDYPEKMSTSGLSPHLHFGEISPLQIWMALENIPKLSPEYSSATLKFKSELGWREFSYYLLYHFSLLPEKNFNSKFDHFKWSKNHNFLRAWQQGNTGYPIVDAGMRQLWQSGIMHNRVRMIVASFLTKDLLIHWRAGAAWFWDTLLDADLANNAMGWQWVAGCGVDAAPYFRIFNPTTQGEKWDPDGNYIKQWIPALAQLPIRYIHKPWLASAATLAAAGVKLGHNYPLPIVDHVEAYQKALLAYRQLSEES